MSQRGTYTIGTYGANVAIALAKRTIDGKGHLTGTFVVNEPLAGSTTGQRNIVTGTQVGTVTVNCDGTGVVTRILTVGTTQTEQFDDFVITGAIMQDGHLIATSIADAQRTPSTIDNRRHLLWLGNWHGPQKNQLVGEPLSMYGSRGEKLEPNRLVIVGSAL